MLETRFKVAILLAVILFACLPILGILRGTSLPPREEEGSQAVDGPADQAGSDERVIPDDLVVIPAGEFVRGTAEGGFDEQPVRRIFLDVYQIDRYEVTNHRYQQFVAATGHRKAGPPSRYAKNMARMRGVNQPVVYVSWDDADAYCRWKGKRLPTEAEWEKAMRGVDGRLWPWGQELDWAASNRAHVDDGFDVAAPVGSFRRDISPFGVTDGAGNVMEWVADWYEEQGYATSDARNPKGAEFGTYKVLRGGAYTTTGKDVRITSRSKMVPDFRDETIGFRCSRSGGDKRETAAIEEVAKSGKSAQKD